MTNQPLRRSRWAARLSVLLLFLTAAVGSAFAAEEARKNFNLPAGPASETLKQFAAQAGVEIVFAPESIGAVTTKAVQGEVAPREALNLMLIGAGLIWSQETSTGAFAVRKGAADPNALRAAPARASDRPLNESAVAEIVQLSPFEVTVDNKGYYASSALSGTRTKSNIDDLASSISVVTKAMLEDTAATDLNDIFLYEANTEGTGNFTAFQMDRSGNIDDRVQSTPQSANRIRGLGSANMALGNFSTSLPLDTYNIDSAEISRGPNSNLFGLGGSGGSVNMNPAVARLDRASSRVQLTADSYGGRRSTFDLNRPVLFIDEVGVQLWMVNRLTNGANPNIPNTDMRFLYNASDIQKNRAATQPLFTMVGISDRSLYDWRSINFVASNWTTRQANTYRIEIEGE